jgi:hypothetical protein
MIYNGLMQETARNLAGIKIVLLYRTLGTKKKSMITRLSFPRRRETRMLIFSYSPPQWRTGSVDEQSQLFHPGNLGSRLD